MPIDTSKSNQKISTSIAQILFEENTTCNSLNLLHEGSYTIEKTCDGILIPLLENSGKNLTPGVASLFLNERYPISITSSSAGILSTYQITRATIKKNIMSKSSLGVAISKTLLKEVLDLQKKATTIHSFNRKIDKLMDNLSVSYFFLYPASLKDVTSKKYHFSDEDSERDPINRVIKKNLSIFFERGGEFEFKPTVSFLSEAHNDIFQKEYSKTINFADKEFVFMRKILSLEQPLQNTIYEADITILLQQCEKLADSFYTALELIDDNTKELHNNFSLLLGKSGLLEKFNTLLELNESGSTSVVPSDLIPVFDFIMTSIPEYLESYKGLFLKDYSGIYDGFASLKQRIEKLKNKVNSEPSSDVTHSTSIQEDFTAMNEELEHSAAKILNYVQFSQDQIKEYSALILKFNSMKNPLDPDQEARNLRRNITKIYWDAYNIAISNYIKNPKSIPKPVEMMLKFGYFDETLLEDKHKTFLFNFKEDSPSSDIPLHYGPEWLSLVANKKVPASISELGETYFDKIKMDVKDVVFKKESDVPETIDTIERRLKHELESMYQPNVRLVTGNPSTFFPILTNYHIVNPLDKCIVTNQNISNVIHEVLKLDYTAFNREVIYNSESEGILKELIQTSVIPDFISIPSIGGKAMMWQDLGITRGAGSKETKGRIILPTFIIGDLKTIVMEAIAAFRWELCKSIMGAEWNNVAAPSLTAEYTDYVMFYKKNKDLSMEVKEKINSDFKRFRTDRDKFANDYLLWMKYESEGIQKLNKVVRSIFYKYIPFHKEVRDKVSLMPAFADIHTRFTNIRGRQYKELEAKYKKYSESHGGVLPQKILANLEFYKV
jgi:hypothetical protein